MRPSWRRRAIAAGVIVVLSLPPSLAQAYNFRTHSRIVEVAAELMAGTYCSVGLGNCGVPLPAPSGVGAAEWTAFQQLAASSAAKLSTLSAGLPSAQGETGCGYVPADNVGNLRVIPINQMNTLPVKGGTPIDGTAITGGAGNHEGVSGCSEVPINLALTDAGTSSCPNGPPGTNADANLRLGRTLGWLGAAADDNMEDTQLWVRPTSSFVTNLVADLIISAPITAVILAVGVVVVAVDCIIALFSGGNCSGDTDTPENLLNEVSPVDILGNALGIPGIDLDRSNDFVGLWHFEDAAQFFTKSDDYNPGNPSSIRGILYHEAGPNGGPGLIDYMILQAGDITGLSLDPGNSAGITKYAQFDQQSRDTSDWMDPTIGHLEFSTLDNLAEYGWTNFASAPTTVRFLMYPLHALGDAAEPHHAAGTTAWGHRPYEDAVDDMLDSQLLAPPASCALPPAYYDFPFLNAGSALSDCPNSMVPCVAPNSVAQSTRIMQAAFGYWSTFGSQFGPGKAPIQAMVQALAISTYQLATANSEVYNDGLSTDYYFGNSSTNQASVAAYEEEGSEMVLPDPRPTIQTLLEQSAAMTIAFLIGAAETAQSPTGTVPGPDGGTAPDAALPTATICLSGQVCGDGGASSCASPCSTNADCETQFCVEGCCEQPPQ